MTAAEKYHWPLVLLIAVATLAGLWANFSAHPIAEIFVQNTALYLVGLTSLVVWTHPNKKKKFYFSLFAIIVVGMAVEWLGINTGFPFGEYHYGDGLGPKLFGIPCVIGVNWFLCIYTSLAVLMIGAETKWWHMILASSVLVLFLDLNLEVVADIKDYWYWKNYDIPPENYIAWWVLAFAFQYFFYKINGRFLNKVAAWTYFILLFFFLILSANL